MATDSVLPFTHEQFFAVFAVYNKSVWPAPIVGYVLGALAIAFVLAGRRPLSDRLVMTVLALMWIWTGAAYHWLFFIEINELAFLFGALFILQGGMFLWSGVLHQHVIFGWRKDFVSAIGIAWLLYAAIVYPIVGFLAGQTYPNVPMFGITPCPVTIFTFGMMLLTAARVPTVLLVIPALWSLIGGTAAFLMGVPQDWPLLVSSLISIPAIVVRDRHIAEGAR